MNAVNKPLLPRVIKIILDVIYGMLIVALAGLVVWMAISSGLVKRTGLLGTASIPVSLGSADRASLEIEFNGDPEMAINAAWIDEAKGILRMETSNPWLILVTNGSKLVLGAGLAYIFYLLRKVMRSILAEDPFQEQNSRLIRRLGYAFLAVGFGSAIVEGLAGLAILNRLPGTIPALHIAANFDPRIVLGASLMIFLLSQIWTYGMELEQERALTV